MFMIFVLLCVYIGLTIAFKPTSVLLRNGLIYAVAIVSVLIASFFVNIYIEHFMH